MEQPKLVIFDCDGVLVDSEPLSLNVLRGSFARYGLDLSLADVTRHFVGGTIAGDMHKARALGANLPDNWVEEIYSEVFAVLDAQVEIIPGVNELLDSLDFAGIGYSVGSNGPVRKMEITLGRTGLLDRLEGRVFSAHDCAAPKPAPDVYLKAAASAGVDPSDCVVIEDSATGARAAENAGMRCFRFCADTSPVLLRPHCVAVFDTMPALPALLGI